MKSKKHLSRLAFIAMLLLPLAVVLLCFGVSVQAQDISLVDALTSAVVGTAGVSKALMLVPMVNIDAPDAATSKPNSVKYRIWLARARDEVDVDKFPQPENSTIFNFPLKAGKVWHYLDCRANSVVPNAAGAGDIAPQLTLTITADIKGMNKQTMDFVYKNNGEYFFMIWENCVTGEKFIGGSPCSPLMMTVTKHGSDDSFNGSTLTFTSTCPEPYYYYEGEIVKDAPAAVAADAVTIALVDGKSQYQLAQNTEATTLTDITNVGDTDEGRIFDILGGGGDNPTQISSGGKFLLKGGAAWSGIAGARITLQVFKTGEAAYSFLELSRS